MSYRSKINKVARRIHPTDALFHRRDIFLGVLGILIGFFIGILSEVLKLLINFVTNISYFGLFSFEEAKPQDHLLGFWALFIPAIGGLIVGLMARFVNQGVYGHGLPETMEKILLKDSLIEKRMLFLKPLAAAISVGTGGPFGDEGPIIATGGTLGSAVGQIIKTSSYERKILLSCGVAGAVAAAFGSPFGGIFLALELMLFEFRARSLVPVVFSALTAELIRMKFVGETLAFSIPTVSLSTDTVDVLCYFSIGLFSGVVAVGITHLVHFLESSLDKLPIHWMWWPAAGGLCVGAIGLIEPRILGAGYETIQNLLSGSILGFAAVSLFGLKLLAWIIGVSSRTTAGTLAPLFFIGSSLGIMLCGMLNQYFPFLYLDFKIAALVGMGALFTGVTRSFLASVFIVLECTHQYWAAVPILAGGVAAYLISLFLMQHSLITHALVKKGIRVPQDTHDEEVQKK
jgi:CIC family chloride channel protein